MGKLPVEETRGGRKKEGEGRRGWSPSLKESKIGLEEQLSSPGEEVRLVEQLSSPVE